MGHTGLGDRGSKTKLPSIVILTQNVIFLLPNHDHLTTLMTFQKSKCELFDRELYFESLNRHCIFIIANLTAKLEG